MNFFTFLFFTLLTSIFNILYEYLNTIFIFLLSSVINPEQKKLNDCELFISCYLNYKWFFTLTWKNPKFLLGFKRKVIRGKWFEVINPSHLARDIFVLLKTKNKTFLSLHYRGRMPWGWSIANMVLFKKIRANLGLDRCRLVGSAAAPIMRETLEYFACLNIRIDECYGMSECTGIFDS